MRNRLCRDCKSCNHLHGYACGVLSFEVSQMNYCEHPVISEVKEVHCVIVSCTSSRASIVW